MYWSRSRSRRFLDLGLHGGQVGALGATDERLAEPRLLCGGGSSRRVLAATAKVRLLASEDSRGGGLGAHGIDGVEEVFVSKSLRGGRAVLWIPHQTPGNELAQSGGPLWCLEDGIHGMRGHLRERETQLAGESGTLTPIASTNTSARLVVPVARAAHDLAYPPYLVDLVSTGEQRLESGNLNSHGTNGPDVHGSRVLSRSQENLGGSVPSCGNVGGVRKLRVCLSSETKVGDLDGVGGRRGRRRHES